MRAVVRYGEVSFLVEAVSYRDLCMEITDSLSPILPSLTPQFICLRLLLLISPDNKSIVDYTSNVKNDTTLMDMWIFSEDSFAKVQQLSEEHHPHLTVVLGLDAYMSLRLPQQVL
ncbi:uncharacterized protein TM35_000121590 [Trypanosoma theileri]|uniref:Uncharacterized protein n=1 Tax=Trypanosoma theileri TaxID=67003 RepID=A0A1X0NXG5_9TRYP|nr:uncharacterized protein TM35_000121590 [Trypanosoma theileri]ORC89384.1 hypothetical protein TM35_000121590 [Trypanosoma theileri]